VLRYSSPNVDCGVAVLQLAVLQLDVDQELVLHDEVDQLDVLQEDVDHDDVLQEEEV
jgi:hypothetical protein